MTRRAWWAVVFVGFVGFVGFGTALYLWPEASPPSAVLGTPTCVDDPAIVAAVQTGATLDIAPRPESGSSPAGFTATSVLVCEAAPGSSLSDPDASIRQTTYVGDGIEAVVEAFDATSFKLKLSILGSCAGDYPNPPVVWLVDESGLGYRPTFPNNHCARPSSEPVDRISQLSVGDDRILSVPPAS